MQLLFFAGINPDVLRTEEKDVPLSEERTGTTRSQIGRARLFEGYIRVNGRPTNFHKTARPDSMWPEAWIRFSKTQKETWNL